jgi:hypothetical protein
MKDVESLWIQLPEDVRAVYDHKYLEKFQVYIKLTNDSCLYNCIWCTQTQEYLILYMGHPRGCIIHNVYPCYRYSFGNIENTMIQFFSKNLKSFIIYSP